MDWHWSLKLNLNIGANLLINHKNKYSVKLYSNVRHKM